jgi:hypothetical protein
VSLTHRPHVGHEVRCDARGCNATTATAAPARYRRTPKSAEAAAHGLGWVTVTIAGQERWVCTLHQIYDPRLQRWVARPLITRNTR